MGKTYKLDQYRIEVEKEPFILELSEDKTVTIPVPTVDAVIEIEETRQTGDLSPLRALELLCGPDFDDIYLSIRHLPGTILGRIVEDVVSHYDLTPEKTPAGGMRALRR